MVFGINNPINMNRLKKHIKNKLPFIIRLKTIWNQLRFNYISPLNLENFGFRGKESHIMLPAHIANICTNKLVFNPTQRLLHIRVSLS